MSDLEALRAEFDRVVRERDDARDRADFLAKECARVKDERDELRACVKSFLHAFNAEPWDEDAQDKAEAALWRAVWP